MSLDGKATDAPITVKDAARFLGGSLSLVYAYVERKQIPHYRMMGRSIRFRLSELAEWRQLSCEWRNRRTRQVDPAMPPVACTPGAVHASGG